MAGPLPCDNHPDTLAVILTSNLESGETLTLCWPCTIQWAQMIVGVNFPEQIAEPDKQAGTEEVADLEPADAAPDASPKTEPEPATAPAPKAKRRAQAAPETAAPGE